MMPDNIPLLGTAPEQPQFPQVQLNLLPQGLMVTVVLGPTTSINQLIEAVMMDEVARQWRESRKNLLDFSRAVKASRND